MQEKLEKKFVVYFFGFFGFQERIHEGNEFMKHLIVIVTFSSTKKLYALETPMECLNSDFIEVHAQAGICSCLFFL